MRLAYRPGERGSIARTGNIKRRFRLSVCDQVKREAMSWLVRQWFGSLASLRLRNRVHNLLFVDVIAGQFSQLFAVTQNDDSMAVLHHFGQFGGDDQQRQTFAAQSLDDVDDFGMCADINSARRLIEDQKFRLRSQPTRQNRPFADCRPKAVRLACSNRA